VVGLEGLAAVVPVKGRFRWLRRAALGVGLVLVAIQLVPVDRSNPPVTADLPAPAPVRAVLRRACYDCHSHETAWPWYGFVAPVSWLIERDVREAREHLNFSTWERYTPEERSENLHEIREEVEEGDMPPASYLRIHRDAVLSAEDRAVLLEWGRGPE
jgi:hypothetical protein